MKGIIGAWKRTSVRKEKHSTSHIRVWREQNSETQFNLWARSKQVVKNVRFPNAPPTKVHKTKTSSEGMSLQRRRVPRTGVAIHSKERMYIVDSGASLHMMGLSSRNHRGKEDYSTFQATHSGFSDRQWHCGLRHTREGLRRWTWRFSMDTCGERFSVSAIVGKTPCN